MSVRSPSLDDVRMSALILGRTFCKRAGNVSRSKEVPSGSIPGLKYGFSFDSIPRSKRLLTFETDVRALVSLAAFDRTMPFLGPFVNKLPLMCINVSRLRYTTEAFSADVRITDPVTEALRFYIETDLKTIRQMRYSASVLPRCTVGNPHLGVTHNDQATRQLISEYTCSTSSYDVALRNLSTALAEEFPRTGRVGTLGHSWDINSHIIKSELCATLPPNELFSEFLHLLRTDGYENYIFHLARRTDAHVDLLVSKDLLFQYKNFSNRVIDNKTVTATFNDAHWYVNITTQPGETE